MLFLDNRFLRGHNCAVEWTQDEKSRSELVQRNEQVKAMSSLAGNGGLALFAAGLGRWFFEKLDENVMLWLSPAMPLCGWA